MTRRSSDHERYQARGNGPTRQRRGHGAGVIDQAGPYAHGYGRIVIAAPAQSRRIVEEKDAPAPTRRSSNVNAGLYAFDVAWLRDAVGQDPAVCRDRRAVPTELVEIAGARRSAAVAVRDAEQNAWWDSSSAINDRRRPGQAETKHIAADDRVTAMNDGVTFLDPCGDVASTRRWRSSRT